MVEKGNTHSRDIRTSSNEPDSDTLIELTLCLCLFLSLYKPKETSSTSSAQSLKCSCTGIVQSSAISVSYCSLQTVSAVTAFTLRITEQMDLESSLQRLKCLVVVIMRGFVITAEFI